MKILETNVGEMQSLICQQAIEKAAPFARWPDRMQKELGRSSTIGGRRLWGGKRDMTEGGAGVPLIASWKGTTPAGRVLSDLVDFMAGKILDQLDVPHALYPRWTGPADLKSSAALTGEGEDA